jgi:hypothetical protein
VVSIEITLPEALAEEVKSAGLLSPDVIEDLLQSKLAADRMRRLQQGRNLLVTRPGETMARQEINAEIKAYRQVQQSAAGFLMPRRLFLG